MDTDTTTLCKELAAIGKSLRVIGTILETGASVEGKRAANGAFDEKKTGKKTATTAAETEAEEETTTISAKTVAAKAKGKTAKAPAETEEDFDLGQEEDAAEETPAVTKKDLIAACRDNREAAIKVLKKMKVNSVHELKPPQYAKVLAEIGA